MMPSGSEQNLLGVRYVACGAREGTIEIRQTPGNALGAYLDGATLIVRANAQDATGDTMNTGEIIIHGSTGDACGYAMRGGKIFVRDSAGYRAGIHMKEYNDRKPVLVIGGKAGSFLGEYQAGGIIAVLGIGFENTVPVGAFAGTGMHGGKIYIRTENLPEDLPPQVHAARVTDFSELAPIVHEYCGHFGADADNLLDSCFFVLTPDSKNPYKQLYCRN